MGKGSFGEVFLCFNIKENKLFAVKLEVNYFKKKSKYDHNLLKQEFIIY